MLDRLRGFFKAAPPEGVKPMPVGEVAYSESRMYGASDFAKYNPDTLIGRRGFAIYRKMMLDEQVKAVVHFKRDAITSRKWYFEFDDEQKEALGEEEAERRVKVFTYAIRKMPGAFVDGLNAMMSAMYHGYSLTEKVYDQMSLPEVDDKEYVVLKALKLRPFDTFNFYPDMYGNIEKLTQTIDSSEREVDITRFVHFVCNPDVDPHYGQSELREAYRAWFSKDHIIKYRNIFLERMAGGLISLETEKGVSIVRGSEAHTDIMNLLANVQTKTGWLLPAGIKANIQFPSGKNDNYEAAIASDDKAMAKALLVPPLLGLSEQGSVGAYSQSQTQLEAFMWTLDSTSGRLAETCNEQVFTELGDLNFGDGVYPRFCFHPLSESMKHVVIGKWKELVTAGAVEVTDTDEKHLRELLDFPEKGEPIKKPVAIDPLTGLPLPGAQPGAEDEQELDEDGKPIKKAPIGKGKEGEAKSERRFAKLNSLYVRRQLMNADELHDWAVSVSIANVTPPNKMHVTNVYSRAPVALAPKTNGIKVSGGKRSIQPLGDKGALVLMFESKELSSRWNEAKAEGATWEYATGYRPHVTLSYDAGGADFSKLKPPSFDLVFGKEIHEEINDDWATDNKLRTKAQRRSTTLARAVKRVDFAVIDNKASALETSTIARLTELMKSISEDLIEQTKALGLTVDLADSLAIKASFKTQMRQAIHRLLKDGWNLGQDHAKRELEKALMSPSPDTNHLTRRHLNRVDDDTQVIRAASAMTNAAAQLFLEQRSYQVAGDVSENLRKRIVTTIFNGIKNSWSLDEVVRRITEETDSYSIPQLNTVVRTTTFEAMNEARYNFFSAPELGGFVEALEYSAILDGRTTDICRELDGRIYPADSDVWNTYRPPNHFNCRSLLVAVTQLDTWTESESPGLLPAEGFG